MNVLGGRSSASEIIIYSDRFTATAVHEAKRGHRASDVDCKIACRVVPLPKLARFPLRWKWLPIPRTLRLAVAILMNFGWLGWLVALSMAISVTVQALGFTATGFTVWISDHAWIVWAISGGILLAMFLFMRVAIASWHGAEHMAIAAYWRGESTDLAAIRSESPVNRKCGGRFFAPILCTSVLINILSLPWWTFLIVLEVGLWIDTMIGFDRIPIFSHCSTLLQRYVTTTRPNECELRTAQVAMESLLLAHKNKEY